jgi:hypothetical protein
MLGEIAVEVGRIKGSRYLTKFDAESLCSIESTDEMLLLSIKDKF